MTKFLLSILIFLSILSCGKIKEKFSSDDNSVNLAEQKEETKKEESENSINESETFDDDNISDINFGADVPSGISYKGKVVESVSWNDGNGSNILFITVTSETGSGDYRNKELFGYHYTDNNNGTKKLWQINDFVRDCPVDITLEFIPNSLTITDLDNNGIAESTFLYRLSCKGDVSPDDMKLMMHEEKNKYAIRGEMLLELAGETYGGSSTPDPSFNNAPPEFLTYAKQQWNNFKVLRY